MPYPTVGLHHITTIASDPQRILDLYTQVLGLRFVKRTVNFDDPGSYHFYLGDDAGSRSRLGDVSARSYLTAAKSKAHQLRRLPVVDKNSHWVGMVSQADLARPEGLDKVHRTVAEIPTPRGTRCEWEDAWRKYGGTR